MYYTSIEKDNSRQDQNLFTIHVTYPKLLVSVRMSIEKGNSR